ncbi:hypothetical protein HK100_001486 [Physocladia obscura]|uniref:Glycoside hydrolase 35 catalytic domain-containing protein n=1 Tax=Physocladia obscura TaxID=109957 RepID=A0AAD5XBT1_9FUNG|nr:hypothetical protein HK100_001486 [Physocladia obscura]
MRGRHAAVVAQVFASVHLKKDKNKKMAHGVGVGVSVGLAVAAAVLLATTAQGRALPGGAAEGEGRSATWVGAHARLDAPLAGGRRRAAGGQQPRVPPVARAGPRALGRRAAPLQGAGRRVRARVPALGLPLALALALAGRRRRRGPRRARRCGAARPVPPPAPAGRRGPRSLRVRRDPGLSVSVSDPVPKQSQQTKQAGAVPPWLLADRRVRIRHSRHTLDKPFDARYAAACRQWFRAVLPVVAEHQVTNPTAKLPCVILLQIENENFESIFSFPLGSADDMRFLARVARDCNITVPLFHNDGFEQASWISFDNPKIVAGREKFGLDLYAFDKYVVFAPTSSPMALIRNADSVNSSAQAAAAWPEWSTDTVEAAMDSMESTVRAFGGCAASGPLFIAELQGGWFNHYKLACSYDSIYNYFGEDYTRLMYDSSLAQGVSILNFYMGYGGTNWGTIGDPDVYTSYDYSACIREFGYVSGRARKLRLAIGFTRSMDPILTATDRIPAKSQTIVVTPRKFFNCQRISVSPKIAELAFMRNFSHDRGSKYRVKLVKRPDVVLAGVLGYKQSFVALGAYSSETSGLHLLFSTAPIHVRTHVVVENGQKTEVWIIQNDAKIGGELAFQGDVRVTKSHGNLQPVVKSVKSANCSVVSFAGSYGWCSLANPDNSSSDKSNEKENTPAELLVLCLPEDDLYTLTPYFEEAFWFSGSTDDQALYEAAKSSDPFSVAWGAYSIQHDIKAKTFDIEWQSVEEKVLCLFSPAAKEVGGVYGFEPFVDDNHPLSKFPGLVVRYRTRVHKMPTLAKIQMGRFHSWQTRTTNFSEYEWKPLEFIGSDKTVPSMDTIDLCYTSGHVIYRLTIPQSEYTPKESAVLKISLNIRHRVTIYLNDQHIVGGHMTYALQIFKAGAKQGPDVFSDYKEYILPTEKMHSGGKDGRDNFVYVVVESFGLNRQPFVFDDVRNARGILNVKLQEETVGIWGMKRRRRVVCGIDIAGVDVRTVADAYNLCGFPDEDQATGWSALTSKTAVEKRDNNDAVAVLRLEKTRAAPQWFQGLLEIDARVAQKAGGLKVPLRLHVTGSATAHFWVSGLYLARYYGNGDCVQHDFYIPDTFVTTAVEGKLPIKILLYGGRGDEGDDWIGVEVKGWEIADGWSGNLVDGNGAVFGVLEESLL